jgi:hypothetical protein
MVRYEVFVLGSQSSVISYQLSVISYQLSVISYQLSVISYQLSVISYQLSVISYQSSVISYQLSVISYQLSVISYQLSVISSLKKAPHLPISPRNAHEVVSPSPPATRTKWSPHLPPQRARSGLPTSQFIIYNS